MILTQQNRKKQEKHTI